MSQFSFEYPWVALLLGVFIICAFFCKAKAKSLYFPHLQSLMFPKGERKNRLLFFLKWLGILFAIIALASPIVKTEYSNTKKNGRDIVLIIDASESMKQEGFDEENRSKNKFDVVKEVANNFVKKRVHDRVGVITFADIAFVASPLTFEKGFLEQIISMQQLGVAGRRTAINDALVQSYAMLENSEAKSKVVILLTDGVDNMSHVSADEIVSLVEKSKVTLYTVGVGSRRDFDGEYLKRLAKVGKGVSFSAENSAMLSRVYEEIDKMEPSDISQKRVVDKVYLFAYPLIFSILFLLFFIYFRTIRSSL